MRSTILGFAAALFAAGTAVAADPADNPIAAKLLELTGGRHMRIVWMQRMNELPKDRPVWQPGSPDYKLMAFDTAEPGERELLAGPTTCYMPIFTPSGKQVIYFTGPPNDKGEVQAAHADGVSLILAWDQHKPSKPKPLTPGWVMHTWSEPKTGTECLFVNRSPAAGKPVVLCRQRVDDAKRFEPMFDEAVYGGIGASADGTRMAGMFPWPKCGVANLVDKTWKLYSQGCWPNLARDNSYRAFVFTGDHKRVNMYDQDATNQREIMVNSMPGVDGSTDVYAPRMTNDPRLFVVSGPLHEPGQDWNAPTSDRADIYVGRFDEAFTKVTNWVRITDNAVFDSYGDGWVEPANPGKKKK